MLTFHGQLWYLLALIIVVVTNHLLLSYNYLLLQICNRHCNIFCLTFKEVIFVYFSLVIVEYTLKSVIVLGKHKNHFQPLLFPRPRLTNW